MVRLSAALTRRLTYRPVFLGLEVASSFSGDGEIFEDRLPRYWDLASRISKKVASFLGACLAFQ